MYYLSGQACIRPDLIAKELSSAENRFLCKFHEQKITKRFLDKLFNQYFVQEYTIHFYDSEPEYPKNHPYDDPWLKTSEGRVFDRKLWRDYEERRMTFNNWIDVFGNGIWGLAQKETDKIAKDSLKDIRKWPISKKGRFFLAEKGDFLYLYCYGRDFKGEDYWFVLQKRNSKNKEPTEFYFV